MVNARKVAIGRIDEKSYETASIDKVKIDRFFDFPQRMILRNPLLKVNIVVKKFWLEIRFITHHEKLHKYRSFCTYTLGMLCSQELFGQQPVKS